AVCAARHHRISIGGELLPGACARRRQDLRGAAPASCAGPQPASGTGQLPARHGRHAGRKPYTAQRAERSALTMRTAEVVRNTKETQIRVKLDLDGSGRAKLVTGLPFLEHMLDQVARHGMLDLEIDAQGDLHID